MMNFEKAFKELNEGKKIRRKEWPKLTCMKLVDGKIKTYRAEHKMYFEDANIVLSNDWVVMDGDGKLLNFLDALKELEAKKWIAKKEWMNEKLEQFILVDNGQLAMCKQVEFLFMPTYKCFQSNDWEIMK